LVYDKCEGIDYNTEKQVCESAKLYDFCGALKMDSAIEGCCNDTTTFTLATKFCHSNRVYDKCGGKEYLPFEGNQLCEDDILKFRCGNEFFYVPETQFCHNHFSVFDKCNGAIYSPPYQKCEDNIVLFKCEDKWYDPSTENCIDNIAKVETFVDERDGITYKYVKIGTQVWMAENLNYNASDGRCNGEKGQTYDYETGKYFELTTSEVQDNCTKYGRLYNWATAKTVCPSDWHLPSKEEWDVLINYVGGNSVAGMHLKAMNGWEEGGNGSDTYGFAALPGGNAGQYIDRFSPGGYSGTWWSSSGFNTVVDIIFIFSNSSEIANGSNGNGWRSVRCIHD
jgi:uncharacterized protein (TIGR02145 family)